MVSPLHRDPDSDGDDYGCYGAEANRQVAELVAETIDLIRSGTLRTWDAVVAHVRQTLEHIGHGATDTIVKENVFAAVMPTVQTTGIAFEWMDIYGW